MHTSRLRDCVQVGEATNCHRAPGAKSKTFTHQQADTIGTKEACGNLSIKVNVPTLDMHAESGTQQAHCAVRIHPPAWQDTNQHNRGGGSHTCLAGRELHPLPNFQVIQRQFKKKGHKHNARWQMAAAAARAPLGNLLSDLGWNARYQDADVRHTRQATFSNPPSARIIHNHLHH